MHAAALHAGVQVRDPRRARPRDGTCRRVVVHLERPGNGHLTEWRRLRGPRRPGGAGPTEGLNHPRTPLIAENVRLRDTIDRLEEVGQSPCAN